MSSHRPAGDGEVSHAGAEGRALPVKPAARVKVWCGEGRSRQPVWLQHRGEGRQVGVKVRGQRGHQQVQPDLADHH